MKLPLSLAFIGYLLPAIIMVVLWEIPFRPPEQYRFYEPENWKPVIENIKNADIIVVGNSMVGALPAKEIEASLGGNCRVFNFEDQLFMRSQGSVPDAMAILSSLNVGPKLVVAEIDSYQWAQTAVKGIDLDLSKSMAEAINGGHLRSFEKQPLLKLYGLSTMFRLTYKNFFPDIVSNSPAPATLKSRFWTWVFDVQCSLVQWALYFGILDKGDYRKIIFPLIEGADFFKTYVLIGYGLEHHFIDRQDVERKLRPRLIEGLHANWKAHLSEANLIDNLQYFRAQEAVLEKRGWKFGYMRLPRDKSLLDFETQNYPYLDTFLNEEKAKNLQLTDLRAKSFFLFDGTHPKFEAANEISHELGASFKEQYGPLLPCLKEKAVAQ